VDPSISIGKFHNPDRPAPLDHDEQGKQGAIKRYAGIANHAFVALRPVHDTGNVDHRVVKLANLAGHMCILHVFS